MRSSAPDPGFGLMEAIATLAVLGVVSAIAVAALGSNLDAARRGRANLEAATLAEWRLGEAVLMGAAELGVLVDDADAGRFAPPFAAYEWTLSVRPVPAEPLLFEIEVLVEGNGAGYSLRTRVFRPPGGGS